CERTRKVEEVRHAAFECGGGDDRSPSSPPPSFLFQPLSRSFALCVSPGQQSSRIGQTRFQCRPLDRVYGRGILPLPPHFSANSASRRAARNNSTSALVLVRGALQIILPRVSIHRVRAAGRNR